MEHTSYCVISVRDFISRKKKVHQIRKDQLSVNSGDDNAPACAMFCTREEFGPEEHLTCYADGFFFTLNLIQGGETRDDSILLFCVLL